MKVDGPPDLLSSHDDLDLVQLPSADLDEDLRGLPSFLYLWSAFGVDYSQPWYKAGISHNATYGW